MTSESDERCRQCGATGLTAERLRWATPVCFRCVRKTASEFADEVSTLRAKLAEAERAWEQHESGDVSCSWHELATGQTIEAERAKAERDAATARAAEAERLLQAIEESSCDSCSVSPDVVAARSHLQSLKAKEPTP